LSCLGVSVLCELVQKRCPASVRTWAKNQARQGNAVTLKAVRWKIWLAGGMKKSPYQRAWSFEAGDLRVTIQATKDISDQEALNELDHMIREVGVEMYERAA